ncbi:MAG: sulfatase family protein [Anaerolineae bacterium]
MSQTSPNIVFICADQLAAAFVGCYGSNVPSTPTLDRLAGEGVRFDRCYATSPVCAPNRATFLTGRSPCVHGIITNNYALATDNPTYARVLQAHGYRTGGFGKFHQTPMHCPVPRNVAFLGFDESVVTEDPKWGPWIDWVARVYPEHLPTALAMAWGWPNHPKPAQAALSAKLRREILNPIQATSAWPSMYPSPLPAEVHDSTFITNLGLDFIRRHLDQHGDQPFFCHISYVDPHDPYDPPAPYATMFHPEDMPNPLPAEWLEQGCATLRAAQKEFPHFEEVYSQPEVMRTLRALYHGSLRFVDDQVARVVSLLEERGLRENTLLVFTTDHGDMLGDHGLITKGVKPYDTSIRCPLIVSGGGVVPGVVDRLTCTLDFYPTFCDWAGVGADSRPPLEGKSFAGDCAGQAEVVPWSEVEVACGQMESVITADGWRLTRFLDEGAGQMFDLRNDPGEQRNLYADPTCSAKRQELLERLVAAMSRPRLVPQYRNMPLVDGKKAPINADRLGEGLPVYKSPESPFL